MQQLSRRHHLQASHCQVFQRFFTYLVIISSPPLHHLCSSCSLLLQALFWLLYFSSNIFPGYSSFSSSSVMVFFIFLQAPPWQFFSYSKLLPSYSSSPPSSSCSPPPCPFSSSSQLPLQVPEPASQCEGAVLLPGERPGPEGVLPVLPGCPPLLPALPAPPPLPPTSLPPPLPHTETDQQPMLKVPLCLFHAQVSLYPLPLFTINRFLKSY